MSVEKYEITHTHVCDYKYDAAGLIAILTGYTAEEVWNLLPEQLRKGGGWYGRDFVATFRSMGYDCSPRFKPFDAATLYPCLLRFGPTKRQLVLESQKLREETGNLKAKARDWWNVVAYYDGIIYDPMCKEPWPLSNWDPAYKITSMMQVWISDL